MDLTSAEAGRPRLWPGAGLIILLGLSLHAASLGWGFHYDDHIHQYLLRYAMDWPGAGPWRLYDFSFWTQAAARQSDASLAPWWISPDFKVSFFRPVTSLSLWLDFQWYGAWAPGYHITNLALFALLLMVLTGMLNELGLARRATLWALAFFSLKDIHVLPVCWIANRNEVLCALFLTAMLWGVAAHGRRGGWRLPVAVVSFLLACMSKETGLIGLPMVGLYVLLFGRPATAGAFLHPLLRLLRSPVLWLFTVVAAVYLAVYVGSGHGSISANYATPWHRTGAYIERVAALFPMAVGSLFFGLSTDMVFTRPHLQGRILAIGSVLLGLLAWLFWRWLRGDRRAWFGAGWVAAALLPMAGVTLSDRLLMSASVGSSIVLGLLLEQMGTRREILGNLRTRWPALLFITTGLALAVPIAVVRQNMFHAMSEADRLGIQFSDIRRPDEPPQTTLALNSPSALLALMLPPTWAVLHDDPESAIYVLQGARRGTRILRESARTLVVTFEDPPLLSHRYERVFLTREDPPPPGTVFSTPAFLVTVLETDKAGLRSVRLEFPDNLDFSPIIFLAWQETAYRRVAMPPIGEVMYLPPPAPTVRWAP